MRTVMKIIIGVTMALIFASYAGALLGDPDAAGSASGSTIDDIARALDPISGPLTRVVLVTALVIAGYMYIMRVGELRAAPRGLRPIVARQPAEAAITLSPEVVALREHIAAAIHRLRAMPASAVAPDMKVDLDAILASHLPDLEQAHRTARRIYPDAGPEAATLDGDLAVSLRLIATRLDEMVEDCGRDARTDFVVERRFIELRHPAGPDGPLALPQARMVDAGG